jgi:pyruvate, orthophosphate dikinase
LSTTSTMNPSQSPEHLYLIGCGIAQANDEPTHGAVTPQMLGFKAYNLSRMVALGLPVPPAFVLGTPYCDSEAARERAAQRHVWNAGLAALERATGRTFGDPHAPLLVSVRSGAPVSMPGMMDTVLNVGLCDRTVHGLLRETGNPRLVWDTYRRLIATYGELIAGIPASAFVAEYHALAGAREERSLDFAELRDLAHRYLAAHLRHAGRPFPQDPAVQLQDAIAHVLASWMSTSACAYRRQFGIGDTPGTAVTVQAMVFGNSGGRSGSGVAFSRNPLDGSPGLWADFLFNAQGEDVVSGRRTAPGRDLLAQSLPAVWSSLTASAATLERAMGDMQDIEFTVEEGHLYILQTRSGKRSKQAAARIALDLLDEGIITAQTALERTASIDPTELVTTRIAAGDGQAPIRLAAAMSANHGVASGEIALDAQRAQQRSNEGASVVLVRRDAETADFAAMKAAAGLLTKNGARTSHAAVVARQMNKACLVGCTELDIDDEARCVRIGESVLHEGDPVTLDGNAGVVYAGLVHTAVEPLTQLQERLGRLRNVR